MVEYVKAADLSEIPKGKMKMVKVKGKKILLANIDGALRAIDDKCPHAHFSLSNGKLDGCVVTCPVHKARFDVNDGKNLKDAQVLFLKMKVSDTTVYDVKLEGTNVLVGV